MNSSAASSAPKGLFPKLSAAISEVERVGKDGKNEFHRYTYTSAEQIYRVIRRPLNEHGLIVVPSVESSERVAEQVGKGQGRATVTRLHMRIIDSETGETLDAYWVGEGQDTGDKSPYKAATGGMKTWLKHLFLLPADDDPEADASIDQRPAPQKQTRKKPSPAQQLAALLKKHQATDDTKAEIRGWIKPDGKIDQGRIKTAIGLLETGETRKLKELVAGAES